jgi:hypothetical protein
VIAVESFDCELDKVFSGAFCNIAKVQKIGKMKQDKRLEAYMAGGNNPDILIDGVEYRAV